MNIYTDIESLPFIENAVVSVGTFDGVHTAHRIILNEVTRLAKAINGQSTIISFSSHPQKLIDPDYRIKLLTNQEEKNRLFQKCGIDNVVYIDFTENIASMYYQDFIQFLISKMNIRKIVVGYDHNFGKDREGNRTNLQKLEKVYGFEVVEIAQQKIDEQKISSSIIRKTIEKGDMTTANQLLGYNYSIDISILSSENNCISAVPIDTEKILPKDGIYPISFEKEFVLMEIDNQKLYIRTQHAFPNGVSSVLFLNNPNVNN